jgi:hypothetical protein
LVSSATASLCSSRFASIRTIGEPALLKLLFRATTLVCNSCLLLLCASRERRMGFYREGRDAEHAEPLGELETGQAELQQPCRHPCRHGRHTSERHSFESHTT